MSADRDCQLYQSKEEKAVLEARNGLLLFDEIKQRIIASTAGFLLTPTALCQLHEIVIHDLYRCAGTFRTSDVDIQGSQHHPPQWVLVPALVQDMCDYVNQNFSKSPIHLAAYVMWRHNWIHPFMGGNGRTSRGLSYLILNARLGFVLPGTNTIPQQIEGNRGPYFAALESADQSLRDGELSLAAMEELLSGMLATQLLDIHNQACGR